MAGCIGAAVARELSKTDASVIMLEAADDVCQGATKGNSGIVHAGCGSIPDAIECHANEHLCMCSPMASTLNRLYYAVRVYCQLLMCPPMGASLCVYSSSAYA